MDFNGIDWNSMWQEDYAQSHWNRGSQKELWDKRAESFDKRIRAATDSKGELDKEDYISKMLARIEVKPGWTILDIGCGPGTLAIPLAKKAKSVTGMDISPEMLKYLKINAEKIGLNNIGCLNLSWKDAFAGKKVGEHDIVVASRSLMSGDIKEAISCINSIALQAVYITLPLINLPFDWEAHRAIGRNGRRNPPYVYFYNLLYQMGIIANIEMLRSRVKVQYPGIEEAIEDLQWRTAPFTPEEKTRLVSFLETKFSRQKGRVFTDEGYSKWMLIWWRKEDQR